jgi:hypothetical protein
MDPLKARHLHVQLVFHDDERHFKFGIRDVASFGEVSLYAPSVARTFGDDNGGLRREKQQFSTSSYSSKSAFFLLPETTSWHAHDITYLMDAERK